MFTLNVLVFPFSNKFLSLFFSASRGVALFLGPKSVINLNVYLYINNVAHLEILSLDVYPHGFKPFFDPSNKGINKYLIISGLKFKVKIQLLK